MSAAQESEGRPDRSIFEAAVAAAARDGEWRINTSGWNGAIGVAVGDDSWYVPVTGGDLGPVTDGSPDSSADTVVLRGADDVWDKLMQSPPPAPCTDVFGATLVGLEIDGPVDTAERHLALRRFGELLRLVANGLACTPVPINSKSQHGRHDQAVGRYVHLQIDGMDHRVYYEEAGSGVGLICQHTAGADARQWRHVLEDERITSHFRVVAYDLPYHGKSLPPQGRAWWAEPYALTRDTAMAVPLALSEVLGLDRPVFIGSSVGGMLALDLARFHPQAFRAVIACEAGLWLGSGAERRPDDDSSAASLGNDPAYHAATMMSWMGATAPEALRQETRLHYAQGAPGVFPGDINYFAVEHDLRGQGHLIDTSICPVHLLTGEYDFVTIPASLDAHREIPGSTMEIMPGLGHFPMSEDPERFLEHVLPILESIAKQ
jgi:pimeloyl-ACP methyl ester carboxylesterase